MKRWVYVIAFKDRLDFDHTFVQTDEGEDMAYLIGRQWAKREYAGKSINDYVVPLD